MMPSAAAFSCIVRDDVDDAVGPSCRGTSRQLVDEEARLVCAAGERRAARARGRAAARRTGARSRRPSPRDACPGRRRTCGRASACERARARVSQYRGQPMDAAQALADLTEISRRSRRPSSSSPDGSVVASTLADGPRRGARRRAGSRGCCASAGRREPSRWRRATGEASVFVVRDDGASSWRRRCPGADGRARLLRPEDAPARGSPRSGQAGAEAATRAASPRSRSASARRRRRRPMTLRRALVVLAAAAGAVALLRRPPDDRGARRRLLRGRLDGLARARLRRRRTACSPLARRRARRGRAAMTDDELRDAIREHALLEGDFVLRSGRRSHYYLDKYRFETRPELLGELGEPDRGGRARGRARGRAARRPRARRRRARGVRVARVRASRSSSSAGRRRATAPETASKGDFERGRDGLPRRGRRHHPAAPPLEAVEALREAGLGCARRSASSTARRAERTRSRGTRSACAALHGRAEVLDGLKSPANPHG